MRRLQANVPEYLACCEVIIAAHRRVLKHGCSSHHDQYWLHGFTPLQEYAALSFRDMHVLMASLDWCTPCDMHAPTMLGLEEIVLQTSDWQIATLNIRAMPAQCSHRCRVQTTHIHIVIPSLAQTEVSHRNASRQPGFNNDGTIQGLELHSPKACSPHS